MGTLYGSHKILGLGPAQARLFQALKLLKLLNSLQASRTHKTIENGVTWSQILCTQTHGERNLGKIQNVASKYLQTIHCIFLTNENEKMLGRVLEPDCQTVRGR